MPARKSRKRKHEEIEQDSDSNEDETSLRNTKRRKVTKKGTSKSPSKRNTKNKNKNKNTKTKKKSNDTDSQQSESNDNENDDQSSDEQPTIRRSVRLSQQNSKKSSPSKGKKSKSKSKSKQTGKAKKGKGRQRGNKSKEEADDDEDEEEEEDKSSSPDSSEFDPSEHSQSQNTRNKNRNKNKPLQRKKRVTASPTKSASKSPRRRTTGLSQSNRNKNKNKNKTQSQRMSVSQSSTQRRRRQRSSQSQSQSQDEESEEEDWKLVQHNERVMQMYQWLTTSRSWSEIKKELQAWVETESDVDDMENYTELTLDICGGVRVMKVEDFEDLDLESLTRKEKEAFVKKLEEAIQVDHEEIEDLPEGQDDEDEDEEDEEAHSDEEKADQESAIQNTKGKKAKAKSKSAKDKKPRTNAEKVLDYDPMLWTNGKMKDQKSFESRYRSLMENIIKSLEMAIFDDDDWIIKTLLEWCQFFARSFRITQFRRLGVFTAYSMCKPLVESMSKQRKPMEKLEEQLERENIQQRNKANRNKRGSPRNKAKIKIKETPRMKQLKENIEDYKVKISNLQSHADVVFKEIAVYKAGDSSELLRCMTLQHIVKWINIDPSTESFLRRQKWQYLFYGLQDKKSAKVRSTALECLMDLFDFEKKFHGNVRRKPKKKKERRDGDGNIIAEEDQLDKTRKEILEPFWDRISGTVDALLKDKDPVVVKKAIEFINILLRGDMLNADDGDCILNYIFDENDEIRQVSAQFIFHDTFDEQAVLKSHESTMPQSDDEDEEKKDGEIRLRVKDKSKMKDDVVEIIQLMKDRVVDLNIKVNSLLKAEKQRIDQQAGRGKEEEEDGMDVDEIHNSQRPQHKALLKENALYRNYVQVSDYIVQSMSSQLSVLREWSILFKMLEDSDKQIQRQRERNVTNKNKGKKDDGVQEMEIKHCIDDEGQTILCYLILSCIKAVTDKLDQQVRNVKQRTGRQIRKTQEEQKERALDALKECVLPHLAQLLEIYQADVFKLYPLIKVIPLIPIRAFDGVKQKEHLNKILASLKTIFMRHDTPFTKMGLFDDSDSDDSQQEKTPEITDEMDEEERRAAEFAIRDKEVAQLRKRIKRDVDKELVEVIGKAFSHLTTKDYDHKEQSARFIYDVVNDITTEFEDLFKKIDKKLDEGQDLATLDALMDDEDDISKMSLMQSLYSNMHKQYAISSGIDCAYISFNESLQSIIKNIFDKFIYDGPNFELSGMLHKLLGAEIARNVTRKINFTAPDMEKMNELRTQKEYLAKLLKYYVEIVFNHITNADKVPSLSWKQSSVVLDRIVSMMDTLTFFPYMNHQSQLLDDIFNNASLQELELVLGVENASQSRSTETSNLKRKLLKICRYVFELPIIEDPFDPSAHTTSENLQIRYLMGCARLCLMNADYYKLFGALIIAFWRRPRIKVSDDNDNDDEKNDIKVSQRALVRRTEIIKNIVQKLFKEKHTKFEEMLFEGMKMIMNDEELSDTLRQHTIENLCKSAFMMKAFKKDRKYWSKFSELFLDYILGPVQNIPKYFMHLHSLTLLFRHLTNRDKLEMWSHFRSLSRRLPDEDQRVNESAWTLYGQFRERLKKEAEKAGRNRNLELDDEAIENYDLHETQSQQPESTVLQDITMNVSEINIEDEDDNDNKENKEQEEEEENNEPEPEQDQNEDEEEEEEEDEGEQRVAVGKKRNQQRTAVAKRTRPSDVTTLPSTSPPVASESEDVTTGVSRMSVAVSKTGNRRNRLQSIEEQKDDEEEDEDEDESDDSDKDTRISHRVSTSKSSKSKSPRKKRNRRLQNSNPSDDEDDEDVDMKDNDEDEDDDEDERSGEISDRTQSTAKSSRSNKPKRGGLGGRRKKRSTTSSTTGSRSGKWLSKKRNK